MQDTGAWPPGKSMPGCEPWDCSCRDRFRTLLRPLPFGVARDRITGVHDCGSINIQLTGLASWLPCCWLIVSLSRLLI